MIIRNCVNNLGVSHIITTKIEHHAVTHTIDDLIRSNNINVSYVKVSKSGHVDLNDLEEILKRSDEKSLVSLMHINNEIGNITDIQLVS